MAELDDLAVNNEMLFVGQLLIATALGVLFIGIAAANWAVVVRYLRAGASGSTVPVLGGLAGMLAVLVVPLAGARRWWWAPLLLDAGTGAWLGIALASWLWARLWRSS